MRPGVWDRMFPGDCAHPVARPELLPSAGRNGHRLLQWIAVAADVAATAQKNHPVRVSETHDEALFQSMAEIVLSLRKLRIQRDQEIISRRRLESAVLRCRVNLDPDREVPSVSSSGGSAQGMCGITVLYHGGPSSTSDGNRTQSIAHATEVLILPQHDRLRQVQSCHVANRRAVSRAASGCL